VQGTGIVRRVVVVQDPTMWIGESEMCKEKDWNVHIDAGHKNLS
jgi:hypothetical protein